VLIGNGITAHGDSHDSMIGGNALSEWVIWPKASVAGPIREYLVRLCRQRLDAFRKQRGDASAICRRSAAPVIGASEMLLAKLRGPH
jgi:hypothetical protein